MGISCVCVMLVADTFYSSSSLVKALVQVTMTVIAQVPMIRRTGRFEGASRSKNSITLV